MMIQWCINLKDSTKQSRKGGIVPVGVLDGVWPRRLSLVWKLLWGAVALHKYLIRNCLLLGFQAANKVDHRGIFLSNLKPDQRTSQLRRGFRVRRSRFMYVIDNEKGGWFSSIALCFERFCSPGLNGQFC